jgi:hypothetical protein
MKRFRRRLPVGGFAISPGFKLTSGHTARHPQFPWSPPMDIQ